MNTNTTYTQVGTHSGPFTYVKPTNIKFSPKNKNISSRKLSHDELLNLAKKNKPSQEWFDETNAD